MSFAAKARPDRDSSFWAVALKIAVRELRASAVKFIFVILAVAAGVGALTGVRGFSDAFHTTLLQKARTLMAADLSVRDFALPTSEQRAAIDGLLHRGARVTRITETLTMMTSPRQPDPLMVSVKAVDPNAYPFYGVVKLRPAVSLSTVLSAGSVAVADDVLLRLHANIGDTVHLGGQDFRIAAAVLAEPDRMSGSLNLGLRVMMTREGLERTGLIRPGSRAAQRYLFKLPATGLPVADAKAELKKAFPEAQVIDYRQTNPSISKGLERATSFLSLVSLIALIVGALGVAMAMHAHLQQKLDGIAVMKSLGARSSQILRIYTIQTLLLGLAGGIIGVVIGAGIQAILPVFIQRYFDLQFSLVWDWRSVVQGMLVGLAATLLFTLPPLLSIRRIRPSVIWRRDMAEAKLPWRARLREARPSLLAGALIVVALGAIAAWLGDSGKMGMYFAGGLLGSLIALSIVARLLLAALRIFQRRFSTRLHSNVRHGIANIYRPGNQAQSVLVALGVGVMFTATVYLVQQTLVKQIVTSAPPDMPNVFLIDIQPSQRDGVVDIIHHAQGIRTHFDIVPAVQARLLSVNGVPLERMDLHGWSRRFLRTRSVMPSATKPEGVEVVKGAWWNAAESTPLVATTEEAAKILGLTPGSELQFESNEQTVRVRVAATYRTEGFRMGGMSEFIFTPAALQGLPAIYYGGIRVKPDDVPALQRTVFERYPTVTVINIAEALSILQDVINQIALVIRFLSIFAIAAGVIILAASVASTRMRRIREVVILKTLGGTRRRIAAIFSVEFLVLGAVAGLMGGLLATGFSRLVLKRLLDGEPRFELAPILVCLVGSALLAMAAGWLASFRILRQKPLEALREE